MKINYNIRLFTIISYVFLVSAFLLPKIIPESYRFGDLRNIWALSVAATFIFHGIAVFLTILNISFIIPKINENKRKYYILILCNIPILLIWGWILTLVITFD